MKIGVTVAAAILGASMPTFGDVSLTDLNPEVTKDEAIGSVKRTVELHIDRRATESELRELAQEIHKPGFDRTFIGYWVKDESKTAYWATTHYNPDLDVNIIGSTLREHEKLDAQDASEHAYDNVVGKWRSTLVGEGILTIYKKDGEYRLESEYSDGSSSDDALEVDQQGNAMKLSTSSGRGHGEYFMLEPGGDLEFWSDNGNFYTAPRI